MSRLLAIGDVHGCSRAFDTLLQFLSLTDADQIVTLGDYVDRGPDSRGTLDRLIKFHESGRVISLRGNHELMMLRARGGWQDERFWRSVGGEQALASYGSADHRGRLNDVPDAHWKFMASTCTNYLETDHHVFVHAGVYPELEMAEQDEGILFWEALVDRGPLENGKTVICGHSEQHSGWPLDLGHTVGIDTFAYGGGWLTALDVITYQFWQANQFGKTRSGELRG